MRDDIMRIIWLRAGPNRIRSPVVVPRRPQDIRALAGTDRCAVLAHGVKSRSLVDLILNLPLSSVHPTLSCSAVRIIHLGIIPSQRHGPVVFALFRAIAVSSPSFNDSHSICEIDFGKRIEESDTGGLGC